ncbi:MAG: 2-succinyl-5-enolpyruvyl-6-hydroxy-3-cyclohexene-1-carboxylic-acid synthase, partial [Deltaproteobacteria bacterium]
GTSGIDGSLSTAIGYASSSPQINTVIVGDLSFFYDSNALWNKYIKKNLRIILINNGGGNIFGFLEQLEKSPVFQQHFLAKHTLKAEPVVRAFDIDYLAASSDAELIEKLTELYRPPARERAVLLEIFTDSQVNTAIYKQLLTSIKEYYCPVKDFQK